MAAAQAPNRVEGLELLMERTFEGMTETFDRLAGYLEEVQN